MSSSTHRVPPLRLRLGYYLWGARLPELYDGWVVQDIYSKGWLLRTATRGTLLVTFFPAWITALDGLTAREGAWLVSGSVGVFVGALALTGTFYRDRAASSQTRGRSLQSPGSRSTRSA